MVDSEVDGREQQIKTLLKELIDSVSQVHGLSTMWDAVWAIEDRTQLRPAGGRDPAIETLVRDTLTSLTKLAPDQLIYGVRAAEFIEALLPIPYTERPHKIARLVRALFSLAQCGHVEVVRMSASTLGKIVRDERGSEVKDMVRDHLRDQCDALQAATQHRNQIQRSGCQGILASLMVILSVAREAPRWLSSSSKTDSQAQRLRIDVLSATAAACGAADAPARALAQETLGALVQASGPVYKASDFVRLFDDQLRILQSSPVDNALIGALGALQAMLQCRGSHDIDRQKMQGLFNALQVHKNSRSQCVRTALCIAIPTFAKNDPIAVQRLPTYTAILVDPLKRMRELADKDAHLAAVANYVGHFGFSCLDDTSQRNIETIMLDVVVSRVGPVEAAWGVLAAIVKGNSSTALIANVMRSAESFVKCSASLELFSHAEVIAQSNATLKEPFVEAMSSLVSRVIQCATSKEQPGGFSGLGTLPVPAKPAGAQAVAQQPQQQGQQAKQQQQGGFFRRIFWKEESHSISAQDDSGVSEDQVVAVLEWLKSSPHTTQSTEETRLNVIPLLRHPSPVVRRECSDAIMSCIERHLSKWKQQHRRMSEPEGGSSRSASPTCERITSASGTNRPQQLSHPGDKDWAGIVDLVEAFARHVVLEDEPHMRLALLQSLEKRLETNASLFELLSEPSVLQHFYTFVHDRNRVRVTALRILCTTSRRCNTKEIVDELSHIVHSIALSLKHTTSTTVLLSHMDDLTCFATAGFAEFFTPHLKLLVGAFCMHIASPHTSEVAQIALLVCLERIIAALKQSDAPLDGCLAEFSRLVPVVHSIIFNGSSQSARQGAVCVFYWLFTVVTIHPTTQEYAELIEGLSQIYIGATSSAARVEVMMMLGVLGAVDPTPLKQEVVTDRFSEIDCGFVCDDYCAIVYNVLLSVLNVTGNEAILRVVIRTLIQIVKFSSVDSIGGKRAARALFALISRADAGQFRIDTLLTLAALFELRRDAVLPLLSELVTLLQNVWALETEFFRAILAVIKAAIESNIPVPTQTESWPWLYPKLVDAVQSCGHETVLRIIEIFECCEEIPPHGVLLVMPCFGTLIEQSQYPLDLRSVAMAAAVKIVCRQNLVRHVPPLMQSIRHMTRQLAGDAHLAVHLKALQPSFHRFQEVFPSVRTTIRRILADCETALEKDETAVVESSSAVFTQGTAASQPQFKEEEANNSMAGLSIDTILLLVGKATAPGSNIDWKQWFGDLQRTLLVGSPHFAFRECVSLYERHPPLRAALFPSAFYCAYFAMSPGDRSRIEAVLHAALATSDSDITACCLALADFMDHGEAFFDDNDQLNDGRSEASRIRKSRSAMSIDNLGHVGSDGSMAAGRCVEDAEQNREQLGYQQQLYSSPITLADAARWAKLFGALAAPDAAATPPSTSHHIAGTPQRQHMHFSLNTSGGKVKPFFTMEELSTAAVSHALNVKAMRYEETMVQRSRFTTEPLSGPAEALARVYVALGMQASVKGLFESGYLKATDPTLLELLQAWPEAHDAYQAKGSDEHNTFYFEGFARTCNFLGKWQEGLECARRHLNESPLPSSDTLDSTSPQVPGQVPSPTSILDAGQHSDFSSCPRRVQSTKELASHGALASWVLGEWDDLKRFSAKLDDDVPLSSLFTGVLFFRREAAGELVNCLDKGRKALEKPLRTLLPLSYVHAYEIVSMLQHYRELEEAMEYHLTPNAARHVQLEGLWRQRFFAMRAKVTPMLYSLAIRSLVLPDAAIGDCWMHFARTVHPTHPEVAIWAAERFHKSTSCCSLVQPAPGSVVQDVSQSSLEYLRLLWNLGRRDEAFNQLSSAIGTFSGMLRRSNQPHQPAATATSVSLSLFGLSPSSREAIGAMQLQLATWTQARNRGHFWFQPCREEVLRHLFAATRSLPASYDSWHQWALMNYRVQQRCNDLTLQERAHFVSKATEGFITAISHARNTPEAQQAILRMLQMWVVNDGLQFLDEFIGAAVYRVSVNSWAAVVPQLIAHLGSERQEARTVMADILRLVCAAHPQALVFPLLVPVLSQVSLRSTLARMILDECCSKFILREAEAVARNLIEAAATPVENFREAFGHVLRSMLDNGNLTATADLTAAKEYLATAAPMDQSGLIRSLQSKVNEFESLFAQELLEDATTVAQIAYEQVDEHLKHTATIYLTKSKSPLRGMRDLLLCVPGEYNVLDTSNFPTISGFVDKLSVIASKHRPRKLQITGSDGRVYPFLLKANEDVRIDERVMQLFSLVNALLMDQRKDTQVSRFPVIPLSSKVGMAGWIENTETLLSTIVTYRRLVSLSEKLEIDAIARDSRDYTSLTGIQRADTFSHALSQSPCNDIARAMWLRAPTAEAWLDRRTTFTSSLAVMSIVGYVLGLGDRHLGNILSRISTGQVVHVDFGDCFDGARCRGSFPETVPFRLTPNLVNAMEVFGVSGIFQSTATQTMAVLRNNNDSIVALLSAFVYDPIVNLRFTEILGHSSHVVERIRAKLDGTEFHPPGQHNSWGILPMRPDIQFCRSLYPRDEAPIAAHSFSAAAISPSMVESPSSAGKSLFPSVYASMSPKEQVGELIRQATSHENLSALYAGWCPWW